MQIKFEPSNYQALVKEFLSKEEVQAYTMAILSFFALAFFMVFAIKPTVTTFFALRREIEDRRTIDQQLDEKINALLKGQEEYHRNKELLELTSQALPKDSQFTAMLKRVEDLAKERNAELISLNVDSFDIVSNKEKKQNTEQNTETTVKTYEGLSFFKFSLSLSSVYQEHEAFLNTLLNLRRIVMLDNTRLTKGQTDEVSDKTINMDLTAKVYYAIK